MSERPIIGWREWVALPELCALPVKAKVDTGAQTSAIHALDLDGFRRRGADWVRFTLLPDQRGRRGEVEVEAHVIDRRMVRSSTGQRELRPVIVTEVVLMERSFPIEVTLTRRDVMGFRMLLGRQALSKRFVVDPARSFVAGRPDKPRRARRG
jgi:hypothetical protein